MQRTVNVWTLVLIGLFFMMDRENSNQVGALTELDTSRYTCHKIDIKFTTQRTKSICRSLMTASKKGQAKKIKVKIQDRSAKPPKKNKKSKIKTKKLLPNKMTVTHYLNRFFWWFLNIFIQTWSKILDASTRGHHSSLSS